MIDVGKTVIVAADGSDAFTTRQTGQRLTFKFQVDASSLPPGGRVP